MILIMMIKKQILYNPITLSLALLFFMTHYQSLRAGPRITIIGTGYVGLVTGAGLAALGNTVTCVDIDAAKIALLNNNQIPIYEPGLADLVSEQKSRGLISFTTQITQAVDTADIVMIAVGTPTNKDGSSDLRAFWSVIDMILPLMTSYKIICTKSTVPVGTNARLVDYFSDHGVSKEIFDIVSNPEFLREGTAVHDFLHPDRIVIGVTSAQSEKLMCDIYQPLIKQGVPVVVTDPTTSETIKYASNSFLAVKLSYINELANLCDQVHADIVALAWAMGLDKRIGHQFFNPGPGYGGSCLPKDTLAFVHSADDHQCSLNIIKAAMDVNKEQQKLPFKKLLSLVNNELEGKTIAILGLAFKAGTDDIRYSPAITLIQELLEHNALIKAYDPAAMNNMAHLFGQVTYCSSALEALDQADAVVIITEWPEFYTLDLKQVKSVMRGSALVDARSIFSTEQLKKSGFAFETIGRGNSFWHIPRRCCSCLLSY